MHLRKDGLFIDAVKNFCKAGGTHFVLCQYPMPLKVIEEKSYRSCYDYTLRMADEIRQKVDVTVYVTVGPYPVDYIKLFEKFGRQKTITIMKKGIDEAARLYQENKIVGIGEIGRPHFPVDEQTLHDSNEILRYGMKKASDVGCPVILHTESTTPVQCKQLCEMGKDVGLSCHKIVKHFSPSLITFEENFGLMPSVLASKKNIVSSLAKGSRFLMETDYIDDRKRPGAVLGPATVPKITKKLVEQGIMSDSQSYDIHVKNPQDTYKISIDE
ncbi:MAG: TatD family hydrolase [Thermoplasmatota archaeon]